MGQLHAKFSLEQHGCSNRHQLIMMRWLGVTRNCYKRTGQVQLQWAGGLDTCEVVPLVSIMRGLTVHFVGRDTIVANTL